MRVLIWTVCLLLFTTCCSRQDKVDFNKTLSSKITYLQVDGGAKVIYTIERFDSTQKIVEKTIYAPNGLINCVMKNYYDSLDRMTLFTSTSFYKDKQPSGNTFYFYYDSTGLMTRQVMISSCETRDSSIFYNTYDRTKRLIEQRTISNSSSWFSGVTKNTYKKDKLIRSEDYDLKEMQLISYDSIVYTDTSKTVYSYSIGLKSKSVTILKKNKPVKELVYYKETFSDDLYLHESTIFTYNIQDSLIKKTETSFAHTAWCGTVTPKVEQTYTYEYKKK